MYGPIVALDTTHEGEGMQDSTIRRIAALWGITLTFCVGLGAHAVRAADLDTPISFDIAAQPLGGALLELSKQASIQLVLDSSAVAAKNTAALSGKMPIREALNRLLRDTEITYRWSGDHTVTIAPRAGTRPAGGLVAPFSSSSGAPTPRYLRAQAGSSANGSG